MIILGVDPGTRVTGFGVVEASGKQHTVVEHGLIKPSANLDHPMRIAEIYAELIEVIERVCPDQMAVEMPVFAQNAQSMLKLGRAQAAAMLAGIHRQLPVNQYTPKEVKKSVTGNGSAAKEQVAYMVCAMLSLTDQLSHDATDALAVALCHAHRARGDGRPRHKDWSSFVAANPDRVR